MTKRYKKGFTIIELVIVIAVIAILAAVLIPTFSSLIKKAQMSADQQVVRDMNLALQADETVSGKPTELKDGEHSVFSVLEADGFKVPTSPSLKDYEYFWIKTENRVVLVEMDGGNPKTVVYPENLIEQEVSLLDWFCLKNGFTAEEVKKAEEGMVIHVGDVYYESVAKMLEEGSSAYEEHNGKKKYIKMGFNIINLNDINDIKNDILKNNLNNIDLSRLASAISSVAENKIEEFRNNNKEFMIDKLSYWNYKYNKISKGISKSRELESFIINLIEKEC